MKSLENKFNGNAGKIQLGAAGLAASLIALQHLFKNAGFKGTLRENIDTFIKSDVALWEP